VRLLEPDGLKPLDATVSLAESLRRSGTRAGVAETGGRPHVDAPLGRAPSAGPAAARSASESGPSPAPLPDAAFRARPQRKSRMVAGAVTAVAILLVGALVVTFWRRPQVAAGSDARPRLAVLPFQDDTGGDSLGWLAAGVTSGLTDALHRVPALTVTPTSGVRPYGEGMNPLPAIARALAVDWLIGGHVERRGDAVVVRAELIDTAGRLVDSREVDGAADEALRLVGDVVDEVSSFLRVRIGDEVRVRGWSAGTRSEAAFRLLHSAVRDVDAADRLGAESHLDAARTLLLRADSALLTAARADERWAEPHIQRALVARKLGVLAARSAEAVEHVAAAFEAGIAHAEQAHRREPGSAAALEARGILRHTLWLHAKPADPQAAARLLGDAERDLRAASAADPSRAKALSALSTIQFARNEYALARASAERAYAADAYLDEAREILARLFNIAFEAADDAAAERWCSELRRRFPDFWFGTSCRLALLTWAADSQPDPGRAWTETSRTIEEASPEYRPMIRAQLEMQMAGVLAKVGLSDSAGRVLDRSRARAYGDTTFSRYPDNAIELLPYEAEVRGLIGQRDSAASLMDRYLDLMPDFRRRFLASRRFRGLEIS
jgi:TolB-like protein